MTQKKLSETKKWLISFMSSVAFIIISLPITYIITGKLTDVINFSTSKNGCPNIFGIILHALVFAVVVRLMMFIPI
jgi:hypothetical protein|tara:strand:+ start:6682 stop:6909 length:228 start_codon:yes stop_codon:yes gene_type:complete